MRETSVNGINMIINGDYCWRVLKENDGSEVYQIHLGEIGDGVLTLMYGRGILSIRAFNTTFSGDGDVFFLEMPFDQTGSIIEALLKGHKLDLAPLYHISTIKLR